MSQGYVIFNTIEEFNTAHEAAKILAGLPKVGFVNGVPAPNNQQTLEVTYAKPHPTNDTVIAYINGGWDDSLKVGMEFKTEDEVSEYFV